MKLYVLIKETVNNIFVVVLNQSNKVLLINSPGILGFTGSKRKTPYAAGALGRKISLELSSKVSAINYIEVIYISPFTKILNAVLRGLKYSSKLNFVKLTARVSTAHNGCRLRKARRK